eukprot:jgi/Botrbrau1/9391/Bobra.0252s0016.1
MYKSGDCRSSRLCNTLALVNTCYVSSSVGQSKFVLPEGEHCNKACQKSNQSQTSPQRQRAPSRREGPPLPPPPSLRSVLPNLSPC